MPMPSCWKSPQFIQGQDCFIFYPSIILGVHYCVYCARVHRNMWRKARCNLADAGASMQFSDRDEHVYFWFPLLAGLSELTFDPRPDIRHSALEVTFLPAMTWCLFFPAKTTMLMPVGLLGNLHIARISEYPKRGQYRSSDRLSSA